MKIYINKLPYFLKYTRLNYRKILLVTLIILSTLILIMLLMRNVFLEQYLNRKLQNINNKYNVVINYEKAYFNHFATINIEQLQLSKDSILSMHFDEIRIKLVFFKMIFLRPDIKELVVRDSEIKILSKSVSHIKNTTAHSKTDHPASLLYKGISAGYNLFDRFIPGYLLLENIQIVDSAAFGGMIVINELKLRKGTYDFNFESVRNGILNKHSLSGTIESGKKLVITTQTKDSLEISIPWLRKPWVKIPPAQSSFKIDKTSRNEYQLGIEFKTEGLKCFHVLLCKDTLLLDKVDNVLAITINPNFIEMDSSSSLRMNKLLFHPYIKLDYDPVTKLELKLSEKFDAEEFLTSIPENFFHLVNGIKAKGTFDYYFHFKVNMTEIDSLVLVSKLKTENLRISEFGKLNFSKLSEPFEYTHYKNGFAQRTFLVGEGNPYFKPLNEIPAFLKSAVLYSEDGMFFYHRGFLPDAIREALIANLKEKRFVRGGSTISMQLVKNLFLKSDKVVSRKIEEMIITWLMENYGFVSKDRLFEIYLNIIEWGPMIYGAQQASLFYFNKNVSELSLPEAIFLAAIIPRPTKFKYAFDNTGRLQKYFGSHYRIVGGRMLKKEVISQDQFDRLVPNVTLTGPAVNLLTITDTIQIDSNQLREIYLREIPPADQD